MSDFGDRVRSKREALGLSQSELAAMAGFKSAGSIGDIEQGKQSATRNIDRLANALRTTTQYLRTGKGSAEAPHQPIDFNDRELALIDKFRRMSEREKSRLEGYVDGARPTRRGARSRPPSRGQPSAPHRQEKAG
ncbi:MAG: helix-turn-helix transcriptional regulator [Proteobacteria bacterium]|nr:helix-turn-helix transcriptional regulator [Pseudomonadota bacterium]